MSLKRWLIIVILVASVLLLSLFFFSHPKHHSLKQNIAGKKKLNYDIMVERMDSVPLPFKHYISNKTYSNSFLKYLSETGQDEIKTKARTRFSNRLESTYTCNVDNYFPNRGVYGGCKLQNICVTDEGEWILFMNKQSAFNLFHIHPNSTSRWVYDARKNRHVLSDVDKEKPLVCYPYSPQYVSSGGMCLRISSVEEPIIFKEGNFSTGNISITDDFIWTVDPVVMFFRYWITVNMGHFIFESLLPISSQLLSHGYDLTQDIIPLFMEDFSNPSSIDHLYIRPIVSQNPIVSEKQSEDWMLFFSNLKPINYCQKGKSFFIDKHPCKQENYQKNTGNEPTKLKACFSSLFMGSHTSFLAQGTSQRELIFPIFRNSILKRLNLQYPTTKTEFTIVIQKKNSQWKDAIVNTEQLVHFLNDNSKEIQKKVVGEFGRLQKKLYGHNFKTVKIVLLELEKLSTAEQVKFFTTVDMYVSTQGSALYYSFLLRQGSTVVMAPRCYKETNQCCNSSAFQHMNIPNTQFVFMTDHNTEIVKCTELLTQQNRTMFCDRTDAHYGSCTLIVDPKMLLELILSIM